MTSSDLNVIYQTRSRTKAGDGRGPRVDRRKTRFGLLSGLTDSDSDDNTAATSSDSDSDGAEDGRNRGPAEAAEAAEDVKAASDGDEEDDACAPPRSRRKRSVSAVLDDSSSDSSGDLLGRPVRRVLPKKRPTLKTPLSDSDSEPDSKRPKKGKDTPAQEAVARKKERQAKLLELSQRRRARASSSVRRALQGSDEENAEEEDDNGEDEGISALVSRSEEETDSDSMKDFIVEDEKPEGGQDEEGEEAQGRSLLFRHIPQMAHESQQTHFQVVVKILLINALDQTFLGSLYDGSRTKRYARDMKNSLYHLDQRTVIPRLDNLKQRSRWSNRYKVCKERRRNCVSKTDVQGALLNLMVKERVECYPDVRILMTGGCDRTCEACELDRHTRFRVHLSGQLYDDKTLQEDTFMPNDTQVFHVGSVCANRTEVYHQLKHYKYHLFRQCQAKVEEEEREKEEEPVKDRVNRIFSWLQDSGWIAEQYEQFEKYLNQADFFQEEKLD